MTLITAQPEMIYDTEKPIWIEMRSEDVGIILS